MKHLVLRSGLLGAVVGLVVAGLGCSQVTEQVTGSLAGMAELPMKDSVSRHGITWTFDKKVTVGRFVTGDWYVVGPVTVVGISPKPVVGDNARNGSVLNMGVQDKLGIDSRLPRGRFDKSIAASLPIAMKPGDSLLSTISVEKARETPRPFRPSDKTVSPVKSAAVLTCMDKPQLGDAFRPSFYDKANTVCLANKLRRNLLPSVKRIGVGGQKKDVLHKRRLATWDVTVIGNFVPTFNRPWIDTLFDGFACPVDYQPQYGRETARVVGIATTLLCCDYTAREKEPLLIGMVQTGIDLWGAVRAGHKGWPAHGGHGNGRKLLIVLAGLMLDDPDMQNPCARYPDLKLSEDMQTMYAKGWTGAKAVYAGHVGSGGMKGKRGWGAYEHLHPRQWAEKLDPPNFHGEAYRRCCTAQAWVCEALALRLMGAESIWRHNAFFDYCDRWMTEDDTEHLKVMKEATGKDFDKPWLRQRQTWDKFVDQMWARYRPTFKPLEGPRK